MIRTATAADLPAIVAIYNATIPGRMATADLQPISVESRIPWFEAHTPERHPLWVLETSGAVGGWLSLSAYHPRPAYGITAEVSIYVAESNRRAGIARQLLAHAIAQAPALGLRTLLGLIFGHNTPSLALFEQFGFVQWGLLPGVTELDGIERDVVIVGKRVGDAPLSLSPSPFDPLPYPRL